MTRKSTSFKLIALLAIGKITDVTDLKPIDTPTEYVPDYSEYIIKGWRVYRYVSNDGEVILWQAVRDIKSFINMLYHTECQIGN